MLARRNPASTARLKICRFCGSSADLHSNRTNNRGNKESTRAAAGGGGVDLQAIVSNGVAAASYLSSFVYRPQPTLTSSAAESAAKENLSKRLDERAEFVAHIKETLSKPGVVGPAYHDDLKVSIRAH